MLYHISVYTICTSAMGCRLRLVGTCMCDNITRSCIACSLVAWVGRMHAPHVTN